METQKSFKERRSYGEYVGISVISPLSPPIQQRLTLRRDENIISKSWDKIVSWVCWTTDAMGFYHLHHRALSASA